MKKRITILILLVGLIILIIIFQTRTIFSSNDNQRGIPVQISTSKNSFMVGGGGVSKNSVIQNQANSKTIINDGVKSSSKYHVKYIRPNNTDPVVELKEPLDNFVSNNGDIEFTYFVHDDGLLRYCILYTNVDGNWQPDKKNKNSLVQPNYPLHFSLKNLPNGNYVWNIVCEDDGSNFNTNNNFSFTVSRVPPEVLTIPDLSLKEDGILTLNLSNYFSDKKGDKLTYEAESSKDINIKIDNTTGIATIEAAKNWFGDVLVTFTAFDKHGLKVKSNSIKITVLEAGDTPPRFISLSPEDESIDTDGYVSFECNVTDDNGLKEVSLYSDTSGEWKLEETKEVSGLTVSMIFDKGNLSGGKYQWACLAKDNNSQETLSDKQKVEVKIDMEIKNDIFPIMVNPVDYSAYVTIIKSSHLKDSLILGDLTILKSNGEVYLKKNMNKVQHFQVNSTNGQIIVYPYEIRVIPSQIFDNYFRIGRKAELTFVLEYIYKGQKYQKQIKHEIEIVEDI